ncbi:glycosyltransferase, partial [Acidobacteria bacterium AH-259-O06]|nr:glycosyltransferase [Acidobacteria bacterium AH-259-O06]
MATDTDVGTSRSQSGSTLAESYPLTVVIPARNVAQELKLCLQALFKNDLTNVEILVVDDASTDSTPEVVSSLREALGESKTKVRYLALEDQSGPAAARNEGVKQAKNPYVLFVDSDVVLAQRTVEWMRESLDLYSHRSDIAGVLGSYSETIPWDDFLTNFKNLYVCFLYRETDTLSPYLHTPIFCVKKEILQNVGGFDPRFSTAEDFRLGIVLGSKGHRFVIDRKIKGTHLKRYTLSTLLKEDWRRVCDLRAIRIDEQQRRFAFKAHRLHRLLSVVLPGPVLFFAALTFLKPIYGEIALLLLFIFYLCNLPLLVYCGRQRGLIFALKAALF